MARGKESLGWGGSGLNGDAGIRLRKALDALEQVNPADIVAKVNELVDAVNTLNGDTAIEQLDDGNVEA